MRIPTLITGALFFVMLGLLTVSYFLDGTAQVVCGASGLLGAVAAFPLFLYLLISKPGHPMQDADDRGPEPAGKQRPGHAAEHERQDRGGEAHNAGSHLPSKHGHGPHEDTKHGYGEHRKIMATRSQKLGAEKVNRDHTSEKKSQKEHSKKVDNARSKGADRPGNAPQKKVLIEKIEETVGILQEECPRCTHLIMVKDKTRPLKIRCPKCNMILVVK